MTDDETKEILAYIDRLDPKRERFTIDSNEDGWMICFPGGFIHPKSFLELVRAGVW